MKWILCLLRFQSRSSIAVKVTDPWVVASDDKGEGTVSWPDDGIEDIWASLSLFWLLILRSKKSPSRPGIVIFSKLTLTSPVSILTTVDMEGRLFAASCVHRSPTFKNLRAASMSKASVIDISMMLSSLPLWYNAHVCSKMTNYEWCIQFLENHSSAFE